MNKITGLPRRLQASIRGYDSTGVVDPDPGSQLIKDPDLDPT